MTKFDWLIAGLTACFAAAVLAAYWYPGVNAEAFKEIAAAFGMALAYLFGKKSGVDA